MFTLELRTMNFFETLHLIPRKTNCQNIINRHSDTHDMHGKGANCQIQAMHHFQGQATFVWTLESRAHSIYYVQHKWENLDGE